MLHESQIHGSAHLWRFEWVTVDLDQSRFCFTPSDNLVWIWHVHADRQTDTHIWLKISWFTELRYQAQLLHYSVYQTELHGYWFRNTTGRGENEKRLHCNPTQNVCIFFMMLENLSGPNKEGVWPIKDCRALNMSVSGLMIFFLQ